MADKPKNDKERRENIDKALGKVYGRTGGVTGSLSSGSSVTGSSGSGSSAVNEAIKKEETPTTPQEFQASLLKRQGYDVTTSKEGVTAVDPTTQRQTVITSMGDIVRAPASATVGQASTVRQLVESSITNQAQKEAPKTEPEIMKTPSGTISQYKPSIEEKTRRYVRSNEGTIPGMLAGTGLILYSYGKGYARGFLSVYNPQTYKDLYRSIFTKQGREEALAGIGQIGDTIRREPERLFEYAGEFKGFGGGVRAGYRALKIGDKIISPYFRKPGNLNLEMIPDVTIETPLRKLKTFEGKKVPTTHATLSSELKIGSEIAAQTKGASGWRAKVGQYNFYTSAPVESRITKIVGNKEIPVSFDKTPLVKRYTPVAYGGYIGIGEGYSSSSDLAAQFSLFPKTPKVFIFRDTPIAATPRSISRLPLKDVVRYQTTTPGTFVSAENIKGASVEGQFTTATGFKDKPFFRIAKGSGELQNIYTYYKLQKPIPELLGGEKAPKLIKSIYDFLTYEEKKVKFIEAKFEPISENFLSKEPINLEMVSDSYSVPKKSLFKNLRKISAPVKEVQPSSQVSKKKILYSSYPGLQSYSKAGYSYSSLPRSYSSSTGQSYTSSVKSSSVSRGSSSSSPSQSRSGSSPSKSVSPSESMFSSSEMKTSSSSPSKSNYPSSSSKSSSSSYNRLVRSMDVNSFMKSQSKIKSDLAAAFDVYVKRGKGDTLIAKSLPRGMALKAGADYILKNLRATFRIKEAGTTTRRDILYNPSPQIFRDYKISKGQKIFTPNQFIQREGKRLITSSEVGELQQAKKTKWRLPGYR